jgi:uncharacterized membrane protein
MRKLRKDTPVANHYGRKAMIFAVIAAVLFISSAVLTAYGIVCPTSAGVCLPSQINAVFAATSVFFLTAGTLLSIIGILSAVESIAVMEKTPKPYIALAVLLLSVVGIVGNVYQFVILKAIEMLFR